MKMVGGTGIIGQDMVCGFAQGKYTQFEGAEIVAENCVKARVKDLVVEGKTYQNLLNGIRRVNPLWSETDDSYSLDIQTGQPMITHYSTLIKPLTTYTLIINITDYTTGIIHIGMRNNTNDTTIQVASNERQVQGKGVRKVTLTTKDTIVDPYIRIFPRGGVQNTYSISKNMLLLEGNYVNTDIPNSINGIESVTEKENNVLSVKINDNTTTLNLPIPLRSLPNNVCDTIEGNKLVQRVGKVVLENIKDYNIADQIKNNNRIGIMVGNVLGSSTRKPIISDHFFDLSNGGESVNGSFSYGGRIFLYLGLSTLEEYVEWFKGNPTTFYYSLSEPIIHDLEIPSISTTKGTNIITCDNNIKPNMTMKVKVKK